MATDWSELKGKYNNFKPYVEDGKYEVKCTDVEVKEVGTNGSVIMKFIFEQTEDYRYPTVDHWLSFKNDGWRKWHSRCLFMGLGLSEEQAEKSVDLCEKKDKASTVKSYEDTFKKCIEKFKPMVKIIVATDENEYACAEFLDPKMAAPKGNKKDNEAAQDNLPTDDEVLNGEEISMDGVPF